MFHNNLNNFYQSIFLTIEENMGVYIQTALFITFVYGLSLWPSIDWRIYALWLTISGSCFLMSSIEIYHKKYMPLGYYLTLILLAIFSYNFYISDNLIMFFIYEELSIYLLYFLVFFSVKDKEVYWAAFFWQMLASFFLILVCLGIGFLFSSFSVSKIYQTELNFTGIIFLKIIFIFLSIAISFRLFIGPYQTYLGDLYENLSGCILTILNVMPTLMVWQLLLYFRFISKYIPEIWQYGMFFIASSSFVIGYLSAVDQNRIARLLAYASRGQLGWIFLGISSATIGGFESAILTLLTYFVAFLCFNLVVYNLLNRFHFVTWSNELSGLLYDKKLHIYGFVLAISILIMTGLPPFLGFWCKVAILLLSRGDLFLIISALGLICELFALYPFLNIIQEMLSSSSNKSNFSLFDYCLPYFAIVICFLLLCISIFPGIMWVFLFHE